MYMSHIALNRIVEERAARDEPYHRALERNRRPLLSHGRRMSDDELLAKLGQLGFDVQRQGILDGFPNFVSAEAMFKAMIASAETSIPGVEVDWVSISARKDIRWRGCPALHSLYSQAAPLMVVLSTECTRWGATPLVHAVAVRNSRSVAPGSPGSMCAQDCGRVSAKVHGRCY